LTMPSKKAKEQEKLEDSSSKAAPHEKRRHIPILRISRLLLQVLFFILLYAGLFQLASLAFPIQMIPVLSSSAAPGVTAVSALDALEHGLSSAILVLFSFALAVFLISGVLVGKGFCSFVCPFGFVQDIIDYVRRPLRKKEVMLSVKTTRSMTRFKYYILGLVLLLITVSGISTVVVSRAYAVRMLGIFSDIPFSVLSPADTLFALIPNLDGHWFTDWGVTLWLRIIILAISLIGAVYIPRFFCRYVCPIAALMAPMNKYTIIGLERNPVKCIGEKCKICERACPMDVPILTSQEKRFSKHPECILCLVCKDACEHKAIRFATL
jgi:ferredoxin-type protein NapH